MLQVLPLLVPRATEIEEPMVFAFMRTDKRRYYCMDAKVSCIMFIARMGVALEMEWLLNCKLL